MISDLSEARPMSLPRSYLHDIAGPLTAITHCGFCEASNKAFNAVVYLLLKTSAQSIIRFVAAKTRVVLLQTQAIPRLELLSVFLFLKLVVSVQNSI